MTNHIIDHLSNTLTDHSGNPLVWSASSDSPTELRVYVDWDNDAFICDQAALTDAANLMPTPVLWNGLTFTNKGVARHEIHADTTDYGLHSLRVECSLATTDGIIIGQNAAPSTEIPVSASTQYTVTFWAKGVSNYASVLMTLDVQDQDGNVIQTQGTTLSAAWTQKTITFTTGAGDSAIRIRLYKTGSTNRTEFDLTGFMLVAGSSAPIVFNAGAPSLYDNITAYVQTAEWGSGRTQHSVDSIMPGMGDAIMRLVNQTRLFSPDYTSSVLHGYTKNGRRIRVDALYNGGTATLWYGWITHFALGVGQYDEPFAELTCTQGLERLQKNPSRLSVQFNQRADEVFDQAIAHVIAAPTAEHYWVLDSSTRSALGRTTSLLDPAEQRSTESGQSTFTVVGDTWQPNTTLWDVSREIFEAEQGVFHQARDGKFAFNSRHFWASNDIAAFATTLDSDAHTGRYEYVDPVNVVRVTCYPREINAGTAVLWQQQSETRLGQGELLVINGSVTSAAGVEISPYSVISPSAGLDFVAVDSHSGADRTDLISVSAENKGTFVEITLRNPTSYRLRLTTLQVRGTTLTRFNAITLEASDVSSIVEHGSLQREWDLPVLDDANTARDYAAFLLHEMKNPRGLITRLVAVGRPAWIENLINWPFGTRLTLSEFQSGSAAHDYFVIGERWKWTQVNELVGELLLMPASSLMFWKLDTSELGDDTVLAY